MPKKFAKNSKLLPKCVCNLSKWIIWDDKKLWFSQIHKLKYAEQCVSLNVFVHLPGGRWLDKIHLPSSEYTCPPFSAWSMKSDEITKPHKFWTKKFILTVRDRKVVQGSWWYLVKNARITENIPSFACGISYRSRSCSRSCQSQSLEQDGWMDGLDVSCVTLMKKLNSTPPLKVPPPPAPPSRDHL